MTTTRHTPRRASATFLALSTLFAAGANLTGCEAPEGDPEEVGAETPAEHAAGAIGFTAVDPWVRTAIRPEGSDVEGAPPVNSAAYLVIRNPGEQDDALVAVDAAMADTVEIHSVTMDDGVMRMRPVDSVAIPAGGEAVLEPGGYHIMLIGIRDALAEGDSVPLTLRFRSGATVDVTAPVRRSPPVQ